AVAFPEAPRPGYAVVVDLAVGEQLRQRLHRDTGVELNGASAVNVTESSDAAPLTGRPAVDEGRPPVAGRTSLAWVSFLQYRDWETGRIGTLLAATTLNIGDVYRTLAAAQGTIGNRGFSQTLLVFLLVIVGGLFLVIEGVALIVGLALAKSITGSVHE